MAWQWIASGGGAFGLGIQLVLRAIRASEGVRNSDTTFGSESQLRPVGKTSSRDRSR
jgi:hypothetical protein